MSSIEITVRQLIIYGSGAMLAGFVAGYVYCLLINPKDGTE